MIERYSGISPKGDLILLRKLADRLADKTFLHINSTREGGGVAEILQRMIPIMSSLGIKARWDVITGDDRFFDMTKKVHNALQGYPETIDEDMWDHHRAVNETNDGWLFGEKQISSGSLHVDIWEGPAVELAARNALYVHPISGWWRERKSLGRYDQEARYALVISLETPGVEVDLHTPISALVPVLVEVPIEI